MTPTLKGPFTSTFTGSKHDRQPGSCRWNYKHKKNGRMTTVAIVAPQGSILASETYGTVELINSAPSGKGSVILVVKSSDLPGHKPHKLSGDTFRRMVSAALCASFPLCPSLASLSIALRAFLQEATRRAVKPKTWHDDSPVKDGAASQPKVSRRATVQPRKQAAKPKGQDVDPKSQAVKPKTKVVRSAQNATAFKIANQFKLIT